jgi:hypothetical protein
MMDRLPSQLASTSRQAWWFSSFMQGSVTGGQELAVSSPSPGPPLLQAAVRRSAAMRWGVWMERMVEMMGLGWSGRNKLVRNLVDLDQGATVSVSVLAPVTRVLVTSTATAFMCFPTVSVASLEVRATSPNLENPWNGIAPSFAFRPL